MKYVIGIGSNLGNKVKNINLAINYIKDIVEVTKISNIYQSYALMKCNDSKKWDIPYLNSAILIISYHNPLNLLQLLEAIEKNMGKNKNYLDWSPRIIDLDILIAEICINYTSSSF